MPGASGIRFWFPVWVGFVGFGFGFGFSPLVLSAGGSVGSGPQSVPIRIYSAVFNHLFLYIYIYIKPLHPLDGGIDVKKWATLCFTAVRRLVTLVFLRCPSWFRTLHFVTATPRGGLGTSIFILHHKVATPILQQLCFTMFFLVWKQLFQ